MIQKLSIKVRNGTQKILDTPREQEKPNKNQIDAHCFLTLEVLYIRNLIPKDRQWASITTVKCLKDCETQERVMHVWPEIADSRMLHHDNASCHTTLSMNEYLAEKNIPIVPQSPYSPDLSPCDFFLFPKIKNHLNVAILMVWRILKKM